MAAIEVAPLGDRFGEDEIAALASALQGVGAPVLPNADESAAKTIADGVDGELVADFLDRLEAFDMACDVYVPVEFESRVEVGELRVGSSQCLIDVLDEMRTISTSKKRRRPAAAKTAKATSTSSARRCANSGSDVRRRAHVGRAQAAPAPAHVGCLTRPWGRCRCRLPR